MTRDRTAHSQRKVRLLKKISFSLLSLLLLLIMLELLLRLCVAPSPFSYGRLFGRELPPVDILPRRTPLQTASASPPEAPQTCPEPRPSPGNTTPRIDKKSQAAPPPAQSPASAELRGIFREDAQLGYVPQENTVSPGRWWQTNNLGARSRTDTSKTADPRKRRIIVFGDSFTNCSRVTQENTWPSLMNEKNNSLEVVNFGVDGYGMTQSLLRYTLVKKQLDYDTAVLVFVPFCDLEREINTCRAIIGWDTNNCYPRFIIQGGSLTLIQSPYKSSAEFLEDNTNGLSARCRQHLRKYDSLYIISKYEIAPFAGHSILYRLVASFDYRIKENRIRNGFKDPDQEAMTISRKIFSTMQEAAEKDGRKFLLVVLPTHDDIAQYGKNALFRSQWERMLNSLKRDNTKCIDLMEDFLKVPAEELDHGCDGTHYGPRGNRIIATIMEKRITGLTCGIISGNGPMPPAQLPPGGSGNR